MYTLRPGMEAGDLCRMPMKSAVVTLHQKNGEIVDTVEGFQTIALDHAGSAEIIWTVRSGITVECIYIRIQSLQNDEELTKEFSSPRALTSGEILTVRFDTGYSYPCEPSE